MHIDAAWGPGWQLISSNVRIGTTGSDPVDVYHWDEPQAPSFRCEHDKEKKLFVLTWPDGRIERFRDNPARQLMVEPDPVTGEPRPAIKQGEPVYVYLCREEREL